MPGKTLLSRKSSNRRKCDKGSLSLDTAVELAHCLGPVSSAKWYFVYWHGFGNLIKGIDQGCTFRLPAREYFLHEGGAECLALSAVTYPWNQSANVVWPADQSWCLAMEIDFFTAYIGCSRSIADLLLSNQRIECSLAESIQCEHFLNLFKPSPLRGSAYLQRFQATDLSSKMTPDGT